MGSNVWVHQHQAFPLFLPFWSYYFLTWFTWGQQASVASEATCSVISCTQSLCTLVLWTWAPYGWVPTLWMGVSALLPVGGDWEGGRMSRQKSLEWNYFHVTFLGNKRKWGLQRAYNISADDLVIECFLKVFCKISVTLRKCTSSNEEQKSGFEHSLSMACCWVTLSFLAQYLVWKVKKVILEKWPLLVSPWTLKELRPCPRVSAHIALMLHTFLLDFAWTGPIW